MPLNDFRSVHLPYCIHKTENGKYVVLNREYKPLGFKTGDFIDYKDYPILVEFKGLTPAKIIKISYNGDSDNKNIYLYNDGCIPTLSKNDMDNYLKRLELLSKLQLK